MSEADARARSAGGASSLRCGRALGSGRGGRAERTAATKVTLQLKWVTQAQFAGYYAAIEKGYYKQGRSRRQDQGRRPEHHARDRRRRQAADFGLDWLPNLFATREKGVEPRLDRAGLRALAG